jgi:plastocyanin
MARSRIALALIVAAGLLLSVCAAVAVAWPLPLGLGLVHAPAKRHGCAPHKRSHHGRRCAKPRHATTDGSTGAPVPVASAPVPTTPVSSAVLVSPLPVVAPPAAPEVPAGEPEAPAEPPSVPHVQVSAVEYAFTLSRTNVPAGKVVLQFVNDGQDPHNLKIAPGEGPLAGSFENEPSKGVANLTLEMQPGQYTLFCSLPTHEEKGMKATLTVE